MDIIERLRADTKELQRGQVEALADAMGVPRSTLRAIVAGTTPDPRYSTVKLIQRWYLLRDMSTLKEKTQ